MIISVGSQLLKEHSLFLTYDLPLQYHHLSFLEAGANTEGMRHFQGLDSRHPPNGKDTELNTFPALSSVTTFLRCESQEDPISRLVVIGRDYSTAQLYALCMDALVLSNRSLKPSKSRCYLFSFSQKCSRFAQSCHRISSGESVISCHILVYVHAHTNTRSLFGKI